MRLERFDHLVLTVRSITATSAFYRDVLLTIAFQKHDGRWLARHTHVSLSPAPA